MRKARKPEPLPLSIKLPPKRIREEFLITYELEGCKKAVNFLTEYYRVRRMRIVLDGERVGKNCYALYIKNTVYFSKAGLKRRVVLHEFYHHLVESTDLEMPLRKEEKEANIFAKNFGNFR